MNEQVHIIDPETSLVGVVHGAHIGQGRPAVILINAGLLHRVGPNRMNTLLARQLGARGFCSLRMDISGLGDSLARRSARDNLEIVSTDMSRAMDFLQQHHGYDEFVLMGLCSGAYDTLRKAETDSRVVGLLNLDGTGYRTRRFYVNHVIFHLLPRLFDVKRWQRLWNRYQETQQQPATSPGADTPRDRSIRTRSGVMSMLAFTDLSREQSGELIESLSQRGVRMRFIFTGGVSGYYNYHGQFDDIFHDFDFGDAVSHGFHPDSDHLTMLQRHRDAVHDDIVDWVAENFSDRDRAQY